MGFRGEALPSIAAVSRMRLVSRDRDAGSAWCLEVEGGEVGPVRPVAGSPGTRVEVRDLFYKVPARLNFLKSERAEGEAILETVRRLALARPGIGLSLTLDGRQAFRAEPCADLLGSGITPRLAVVIGREFVADAVEIEAARDGDRAHRLHRPAHLQPQGRALAVPDRQRPPGPGPAAAPGAAGRL